MPVFATRIHKCLRLGKANSSTSPTICCAIEREASHPPLEEFRIGGVRAACRVLYHAGSCSESQLVGRGNEEGLGHPS